MHADSVGQGSMVETAACVLPDTIKGTEAEPVRSCRPVNRTRQACIQPVSQVLQPNHVKVGRERLPHDSQRQQFLPWFAVQ